MPSPLSWSNAALWSRLDAQTGVRASAAKLSQEASLPAMAPTGRAWSEFVATGTQPYINELDRSVGCIRKFIQLHAANSAQKQEALCSLHDFESTKIRCKPGSLTPLMVNENRRNLNLIAHQLGNEAIPIALRTGIALALAQGVSVCQEGIALNILNCASELTQQQQGLAGLVVKTKNEMVDQHLLALVRQQDARNLSPRLAKDLEIHHVQALKNHVANAWGLPVLEDRYATARYQQQAGAMAEALLQKTITPTALATVVAEKLASQLCSLTEHNLQVGMPVAQLKTEALRPMLQAEFGKAIDLDHCLEFNDDYTKVKLQSPQALQRRVLQAFQRIGLVPEDASIELLAQQSAVSLELALEEVTGLQGRLESQSVQVLPVWNLNFWHGDTKDDDRRKSKLHH